MNTVFRLIAIVGLTLGAASSSLAQTARPDESSTVPAGKPVAGIKKVIPRGMLLHVPATQPACSKLPTSYELGSCFQLDDTHGLLVSNLDEQGGPDLCVGNDAFVFEKLSDIRPEKAIIINRAEPEYVGPGRRRPASSPSIR